jgi:hypothetical protein
MKLSPRFARPSDGLPRARLGWRAVARPAVTVGGAALVIALAGWTFNGRPAGLGMSGLGQPLGRHAPAGLYVHVHASPAASARMSFRGIILPDLLIVKPTGLTRSEVARLGRIKGVRRLITFDGAQITLDGRPVSVIGVSPNQFRSWVPLRTASDQRLWGRLAAGDFIAESTAATRLRLAGADSYRLTGRSAASVRYGGAASLGIAGVDLVVNQDVSRTLGLVDQVAALVSAPGAAMSSLTHQVKGLLGSRVSLVDLRGQQPGGPTAPRHITNYLQLFQASSAKYCPALSWTVLAAIGQIESADGRNVGPSSAGALGPMQFLPSTWAIWGIDGFGPSGPPNVMNPFDAVPSAARMLCADGASAGTQAGLRQAIFDYNHAVWYVDDVLALAAQYAAEYR